MRMILNNENTRSGDEPLKLGQLRPGEKAEILAFSIDEDLHHFLQRLYEVGFLVGERVEVLHEAPLTKNPFSVKIKEATYALRREDANLIQVKRLRDH